MTEGFPEKKEIKFSLALFIFFLVAASGSLGWGAEKSYPNRPINMIMGFAPGGASDLGSKIISERMAEFLGQPMIGVYKPGGGGTLAASFVAKAKPDGYTVLTLNNSMNLPAEVKKLDYQLEDFILTGMWARGPYFLAVKADARWKTFPELVEEAKKAPGKLTYGSGGMLTGGQFTYELLSRRAGIKLTHVPFKSCGEAMTALLGGHIDVYLCVGVGAISEPNLVRPLATGEAKRLEGIQEIPTLTELGYPVLYSNALTFAVPKGTPKEVVDRLTGAQKKCIEKYAKEIGEALRKVDMWSVSLDHETTYKEFKKQYDEIGMIMKETKPAGK